MTKAALFWSGGKDSAMALYTIQKYYSHLEVVCLITTLNSEYKRISMHGVRQELLELQAQSVGLPLQKMWVKNEPTNQSYEAELHTTLSGLKEQGIEFIVFGDIFLEDLKLYRNDILKQHGLTGVYPLWKKPTSALIRNFISLGFQTITCCISTKYLDEKWLGKIIDDEFINTLPVNTDPCGENGEFHTFCFDGPVFKTPVQLKTGDRKYQPLMIRQTADEAEGVGFWFIDLVFT